MPDTAAWHNRIVDYDPAVPLDQLLAHPMNPKLHPTAQTEAIKGILGEVGWLDGIKVNVQTQHVLDGHDRIKAAMQAGQTTAPVFYVDVPADQEAYVLATFDPVGALAGTDSAILDALLRDVQSGDAAVQALLAEVARGAGLYLTPPVGAGAGGDEFDVTPGAGPTRTSVGDVWELGPHRLGVFDSFDPLAWAALLGGEQARFEFSDPPYRMDTEGGGVLRNSPHMRAIKARALDTFQPSDLIPVARTAVFCCNKALILDYIQLAMVWGVAWDLCFYAKQNTPPNYGGHMMTDIEYLILLGHQDPNPGLEKEVYSKAYFGTLDDGAAVAWAKPLGLVEKYIRLFSKAGDVVVDRFSGTGTSLVGAHRQGRVFYGCERDPVMADVILRRAEAEGITPIVRAA